MRGRITSASLPTSSSRKAQTRDNAIMQLVPYSKDDSKEFYQEYYLDDQRGSKVQVYKGRDVMGGNGVGASIMRVAALLLKFMGRSLLKRGIWEHQK